MSFAELVVEADPSRIDEQLVVTLDAQLFYSVLQALHYLVQYPYECTEQTLNRFLSTGIVSSLYERYPAVARMARKMAAKVKAEVISRGLPSRRSVVGSNSQSSGIRFVRASREPTMTATTPIPQKRPVSR